VPWPRRVPRKPPVFYHRGVSRPFWIKGNTLKIPRKWYFMDLRAMFDGSRITVARGLEESLTVRISSNALRFALVNVYLATNLLPWSLFFAIAVHTSSGRAACFMQSGTWRCLAAAQCREQSCEPRRQSPPCPHPVISRVLLFTRSSKCSCSLRCLFNS